MGGGGHFISYSGRVFTATPDDDMEHVYEENQNETGFEFVLLMISQTIPCQMAYCHNNF